MTPRERWEAALAAVLREMEAGHRPGPAFAAALEAPMRELREARAEALAFAARRRAEGK